MKPIKENKYQKAFNIIKSRYIGNAPEQIPICEIYKEECNDIQELINYHSNRDREFIDQLHYAHEHLYACRSDFYSNGEHIYSYYIEKLETAKDIIDNTLNYLKERVKNETNNK